MRTIDPTWVASCNLEKPTTSNNYYSPLIFLNIVWVFKFTRNQAILSNFLQTTLAMDKLKRVLGGRENEEDDGIMSEVMVYNSACNYC